MKGKKKDRAKQNETKVNQDTQHEAETNAAQAEAGMGSTETEGDDIAKEAINEAINTPPQTTDELLNQTTQASDPVTTLEVKLAQSQDQYKRTLAEFDNFRKRTAKEMAARYEDGQRAAAEKLLPVVDNFERAMNASENKEDQFYQGIALIARQLEQALADMGIEPIKADPGTTFDHNLHHAVAHVEDDAYGQSEIVEILQKGYKQRDKVLRPSMVKVAN